MDTVLYYLRDLCVNNNKEWFEANKDRYLQAKKRVEDVSAGLIERVSVWDKTIAGLQAKDTTFRIYRDVRFSNDKTPYKNNMGAYLVKGGKKSGLAGYYLHIEPDNSFVACGLWMPPSPMLQAVRTYISNHGTEFHDILTKPEFVKAFDGLEGEPTKTMPRGFAKDIPFAQLLKYKSYTVTHAFSDEDVLSSPFIDSVHQHFTLMHGFINFLNAAIE